MVTNLLGRFTGIVLLRSSAKRFCQGVADPARNRIG